MGRVRDNLGTVQFDQTRIELRIGGAPVEVQRKPWEVLVERLIQAGQVVAKEQLLKSVWHGRPTVNNVVGMRSSVRWHVRLLTCNARAVGMLCPTASRSSIRSI